MRSENDASSEKPHNGLVEQITLGPREGVRVPLGVFEASIPPPDYDLIYDPEPESNTITATLKRIDEGAEYQLVYFFQNFTEETYKITIRERYTDEDDSRTIGNITRR